MRMGSRLEVLQHSHGARSFCGGGTTGQDSGERWQYERKHPSQSANGMPWGEDPAARGAARVPAPSCYPWCLRSTPVSSTLHSCSGLQTVPRRLANTPVCRPAICANTRVLGPTLHANGPTLICKRLANRPVGQHAMRIGLPHARPWCRGNPSRDAGDSRACKDRRWSLILAGFGRLALCHA
jgi:hypothetical protein